MSSLFGEVAVAVETRNFRRMFESSRWTLQVSWQARCVEKSQLTSEILAHAVWDVSRVWQECPQQSNRAELQRSSQPT